jgi:transcription initiation factor TFIIE subunit alpha
MLEEHLRQFSRPTSEKKEYSCPRCLAQWTQMDVLDDFDANGSFICKRCGHALNYHPYDREDEPDRDNILGQFNRQFARLVSLLKQIDDTIVPLVTGETALADARPVPRERPPLESAPSTVVGATKARPTAVVGIKTGPEKVEVTLTTDSENNAAAQAAAAERRARIVAQNQLPEWHTHSTVSNDITAAGQREEAARRELDSLAQPQAEEEEKKVVEDDTLDAYFKALKEEQEREAKQREQDEAEEDEDDDDDDEDEDDDEDDFESLWARRRIPPMVLQMG